MGKKYPRNTVMKMNSLKGYRKRRKDIGHKSTRSNDFAQEINPAHTLKVTIR